MYEYINMDMSMGMDMNMNIRRSIGLENVNLYALFFIVFVTIMILFYGYVKVKYRFWSIQPVFHAYNILYWMRPPGLIENRFPKKNKFVNTRDIFFRDFSTVSKDTIQESVSLIQNHYLKLKDAHYYPEESNFIPYFRGHNDPSFLSTYFYQDHLKNKEIIGTMTTRPLSIRLFNKQTKIYYVDHLCVHGGYRNKGYAPELIQTHNYHQCHANPKIMCSLFKKETDLTGIVPLTIYTTYGFNITTWKQNYRLHSSIQLLEVSKKNIHILHEFLREMMLKEDKFSCFIMPSIGNIQSLIETQNIFVYMGMQNGNVLSTYFFRRSCLTYQEKKGSIECFCTIQNMEHKQREDMLFVYMFSEALKRVIRREKKYSIHYLLLENNSDTKEILINIRLKYEPEFESPTAYYLYNYGVRPIEEFRVCIIN